MNRGVQPQSLWIRLGGVRAVELREMSLTVPQAKRKRGEEWKLSNQDQSSDHSFEGASV